MLPASSQWSWVRSCHFVHESLVVRWPHLRHLCIYILCSHRISHRRSNTDFRLPHPAEKSVSHHHRGGVRVHSHIPAWPASDINRFAGFKRVFISPPRVYSDLEAWNSVTADRSTLTATCRKETLLPTVSTWPGRLKETINATWKRNVYCTEWFQLLFNFSPTRHKRQPLL